MNQGRKSQIHRILSMYERLTNGGTLIKKEESARFQISEKSIQRDIDSIRNSLELEKNNEYIDYNYSRKSVCFRNKDTKMAKK